jgi:alkyl hydroperoxide reductase subunit AhpF
MAILSESDRNHVREMLSHMVEPVGLVFFSQTLNCETCVPTRQILDELVLLSDKLTLEEVNPQIDRDRATGFGVDAVPAIIVTSGDRSRIRFFGAPSGYEFMSLLDAIVLQSTGQSGLTEASRALIAAIREPVDIKVFVTPT